LRHLADLELAVRHQPFSEVFGTALGPRELFAVVQQARAALARAEVCGVVITAGTGILEEAAYLSELLNDTGKPIVWTGAQYAADAPDSDGPRNLRNAVRVAASPGARSCGTGGLVAFNQEVYAARDVVKLHRNNLAAFSALDAGILARADEDRVVWRRAVPARPVFAVDHLVTDVDLITLVAGCDDRFFRASIAAGARGLVIEGFPGVGMICPGVQGGVRAALDAGLCVVLSSRSPCGRMIAKYGGELGGATLQHQGVVLGGELAPAKLRILLMVLLAHTRDRGVVRARIEELAS
ncbi:MAG TPA: asparaginase domain-containing protein, partial [Kofleriaceae bacterium]|nr:asparaginase domain-containing protein [Kofleriaceae bacterium]